MVITGVRKEQWPGYISDIFRILKPEVGWVQCGEMGQPYCDDTIPEDTFYARVSNQNFSANSKYRRMYKTILDRENVFTTGELLEHYFLCAGFADVKLIVRKLCIGDWGRQIPSLIHPANLRKHYQLFRASEHCPKGLSKSDPWPDREFQGQFH